jgi:dTDP-4-amino-4,6-dideoxygalactose transaminase
MSRTPVPLVDLRAQYASIRPEVDEAMARVISRTSFILGEEVEAFEQEFARYCEVGHAVGCGNGTDALELALQAVGVKPGDEVITVSHTFTATAEAVVNVGARPVFVDVRPDTLLMDVRLVAAAITPRTRAIVPVHLYGQVVDMDPLLELARSHGLRVVEDAAQAHGARYKGRRAGSMGDAGSFSFYPGKNLGAYGDAGAIVTRDREAADWMRRARNHGRATKYEHDFVGRNSRMDGLQGAVLRVKLRHLDGWNERRRELAAAYRKHLAGATSVSVVVPQAEVESAYHLFVVRVPRRDALLERLKKEGVEAGVHYPVPLHRQKAYAPYPPTPPRLEVTEAAAASILSLPLYPELDPKELARIAELVARG